MILNISLKNGIAIANRTLLSKQKTIPIVNLVACFKDLPDPPEEKSIHFKIHYLILKICLNS
jgi:hypothetical protein